MVWNTERSIDGLRSYRLTQAACRRLALPDAFWPTIHELGELVDEAPGYTPEMWENLSGFLAEDMRTLVPRGLAGTFAVEDPANGVLIGIFTRHDLRVIHTRIAKAPLRHLTATEVMRAYDSRFAATADLDDDWLGFLSRQWEYISGSDEVLVIVCHAGESDLFAE